LGENTSHYLCSSLAAKGGFIGVNKGEQRESLSPGMNFDPGNEENFINKHKDYGGIKR
jgi:hypothetical protein